MIGPGKNDARLDVSVGRPLYRFMRNQLSQDSRFDDLVAIIKAKAAYQDGMLGVHFDENSITFNHTLKEISAVVPELFVMMFQKDKLKQISISEEYLFDPKFLDKESGILAERCQTPIHQQQIALLAQLENARNKKIKIHPIEISRKPVSDVILTQAEVASGVCVGELHDNIEHKKLLIQLLPQLKKSGVTHLFLENTITETQKQLFEYFFQTGKMPVVLVDFLRQMDLAEGTQGPYGFLGLAVMAQLNGIRIVPLDTIATHDKAAMYAYTASEEEALKNRLIMFNFNAANIIATTENVNKYIVFCGAAHSNYLNHTGVPGVADVLAIPSVRMTDYDLYFKLDRNVIREEDFAELDLPVQEILITGMQEVLNGETLQVVLPDFVPLTKKIAAMSDYLDDLKKEVSDEKWNNAGKSILFFVKPWTPIGIEKLRNALASNQLKNDEAVMRKFHECLNLLREASERSEPLLGKRETTGFYDKKYEEGQAVLTGKYQKMALK